MAMLTSGTFTLSFDGQTTSAIAWDASASTVQSALESLSNIDADNSSSDVVRITNADLGGCFRRAALGGDLRPIHAVEYNIWSPGPIPPGCRRPGLSFQ